MKISTLRVPQFALTVIPRILLGVSVSTVALGITSTLLPKASFAQSASDVQPLEDLTTPQNERDSFSGSSSGFSVFDLMHRAQQGGLPDFDTFLLEKRESLDDAAQEFRRQQLEQLRTQPQDSPTQPEDTSETAN